VTTSLLVCLTSLLLLEPLPSDHGGCALHPNTYTLSFDRDMAGETNMTMSGVSLVKTFASLQPLGFQT
jgi:hypothetical protein